MWVETKWSGRNDGIANAGRESLVTRARLFRRNRLSIVVLILGAPRATPRASQGLPPTTKNYSVRRLIAAAALHACEVLTPGQRDWAQSVTRASRELRIRPEKNNDK